MSFRSVIQKDVWRFFQRGGVRPLKRFGQNFLIDQSVIRKILKAAKLKLGDTVLEIGPGPGNLTKEIAKRVKRVVAVEKDKKMSKILEETIRSLSNVEIIYEDILKVQPKNLKMFLPDEYKIVANLPFYLTAPFIRKFLESFEIQPLAMTLIVQKEVAQRICAHPPKMNLLAISVQFYAKTQIINYISKKSFWPKPKVDSAILEIIPFKPTCLLAENKVFSRSFFKIVRSGFSQPRKQLLNNFSRVLKLNKERTRKWLLENDINPHQRAQNLGINDWLKLTHSFLG